jgi:dephospho-CoA kinase
MIKIGLTGGIASGKSQVGLYLGELGAHVINADLVAHEAYAPGTEGFHALIEAFGPKIVSPDGIIDRATLGARVFGNRAELARLTAIVWPLARSLVERRMAEQADAGTRVVVVEAALLFEAEWQGMFDEIWLVEAPREALLERLRGRGIAGPDAERRLGAVTDAANARALSTRIIQNDADLDTLRRRVEEAWRAATNSPAPAKRRGD